MHLAHPIYKRAVHQWPSVTVLAYNHRSKATRLKQNKHVQAVHSAAMWKAIEYVCFKDAFPNVSFGEHKLMRKLLIHCAKKLGEEEILERLEKDVDYAKEFAYIVSTVALLLYYADTRIA